jgi:hypothetical protein
MLLVVNHYALAFFFLSPHLVWAHVNAMQKVVNKNVSVLFLFCDCKAIALFLFFFASSHKSHDHWELAMPYTLAYTTQQTSTSEF